MNRVQTAPWRAPRPGRRSLGLLLLVAAPLHATAQGTWMHTQCLAGAGATGACKAQPAWGQTGLDHVQALAASAGPGNLGLSLVKPETLPAANAARAQVAAVMLGYLDGNRPAMAYRWFGPVAPPAPPRTAGQARALAAATQPGTTGAGTAGVAAPGTPPPVAIAPAAPPAPAHADVQAAWRAGALGDEPQRRSASWWLAGPYYGSFAPLEVDTGNDRYRVLRFLAAQCPQLEGKVAPNAWTRCTNRTPP